MKALALAAIAALMSTAALAQEAAAPAAPAAAAAEPPADPRFVEYPVWLPRDQSRESLFPQKALEKGVSGHAEAICTVKDNGRLEKCTIDVETPRQYGFGDALLKLTKLMKIKTVDEDGAPTAGKLIRVPFDFTVPK